MRVTGLVAIILGLGLVALSFLWVTVSPPENRWTDEQAKEHRQNVALYHQLQHTVGGAQGKSASAAKTGSQPTKEDLERARQRWQESDTALRAAQAAGPRTAWWLRVAGLTVTAIGVAAILLSKRKPPKADDE
jgi:hypothetical protein